MGDYECDQARYSQENGFVPVPSQALLCQVHPACSPGSDTWINLGPKGMIYNYPCLDILLLTRLQRPEQNETSLAVVPRNHAILSIPNLEAESSGLLDRLLGVFQEETRYGF